MSALPDIEIVSAGRYKVAESPLWDAATACLWWVDAVGREVFRSETKTGDTTIYEMPHAPSALALGEDDDVIVAAGTGWYRLTPADGEITQVASIDNPRPGVRLNDGVVDGAGRFWVGSMSTSAEREPIGQLFCLGGGHVTTTLDGLRTQNGAAVSPDGKTFYLADSHPSVNTIWAFDFDEAAGELSNRRVFHRPEHGRPDGAAVDAESCYWFAAIDAGHIVRLDPEGRVMRTIGLPVSRPTKPAFGGPDLSTLFVTTMSFGLYEERLAAEPMAGAVLALDAGVRGLRPQRVKRMPAGQRARLHA